MKELLPKEDMLLEMGGDSTHAMVMASLYQEDGWRIWGMCPLESLPNELISREDLSRFGIGA